MGLAFYINKYILFIVGIIVIPLYLFIFINYIKSKQIDKERLEYVKDLILSAIYDSKHRINECEIAINENSK